MKLKTVSSEINISATREKVWEVLSQYGNVSSFHGGVNKSYPEQGSEDKASLGGERICHVVDSGIKITLEERIIEYVEGEYYKYEVYKWKNFPIQKMFFTFRIKSADQGSAILQLDIDYKSKPAFLTWLMQGKTRRLTQNILLGYKHFIETGKRNTSIKELKRKYREVKKDLKMSKPLIHSTS